MSAVKFNGSLASAWALLCPDFQKLQDLVASDNATAAQVQGYLSGCYFAKYVDIVQSYYRINGSMCAFLACVGLIGTLFILATLLLTKSAYFQAPTYRYFRFLIVIQSLVMVGCIHESIRNLTNDMDRRWYSWYLVTVYIEPILIFLCSSWAECLIFYLSVERAVACLFPSIFSRMIGKKWFSVVIAATLVAACFCDVPFVARMTITYNTNLYLYSTAPPTPAVSNITITIRSVAYSLKFVLLTIATIAAVVGFFTAYKRKQRLQKTTNFSQQGQAEWRITAQLCTLQLVQALPAAVSCLIAIIGGLNTFYNPPSLSTVLASVTDEQIMAVLAWYSAWYRTQEWFEAIRILGHSAHFYLYYACSRPFRSASRSAISELLAAMARKIAPEIAAVTQQPQTSSTNARIASERQAGQASVDVRRNMMASGLGTQS